MTTGSRSAAAAGGVPRDPSELLDQLGVSLDAELIECALTHRSYAYENGNVPHNERLEFLGDSVLSVVVTDALYRGFPDLAEGRLAKMRASVVNMRALAGVARGIGPGGLGAYLRLGRGEETTGGRQKASILADALEAVLGAVYLGAGIEGADRVVHLLFDAVLERSARQGAALDWKTSLQELTATMSLGVPEYLIVADGPDHLRTFTARAVVAGEQFAARDGRNKKEAEQAAAATAWQALRQRTADGAPRPSVDGSTADGSPVDGSPVDGSPVDGSLVDGLSVDGSPAVLADREVAP